MQDDATHQLNIKMPHLEHTLSDLPYHGKSLRKEVLQRLSIG